MRVLADENVVPAHVSALDSAGHDVRRSDDVLEKGATDVVVLETATEANRVVLTYDRKDFSDVTDHSGVLIATEDMKPRDLRNAVERVATAYPALDDVVEYLSDWT
jgi:predicted nuclease of predicted toxin-antitoxin system